MSGVSLGECSTLITPESRRNCLELVTKIPHRCERLRESFDFSCSALPDCHDGAVFDSYIGKYIGGNIVEAKECAEALERITHTRHTVQLVKKRTIFSDVYKVVGEK